MALVNCIECGELVSDTATECPPCKKVAPMGVNCAICRQIDKASSLLTFQAMYGLGQKIQVHCECVKSLFSRDATCWECGDMVWNGQNWEEGLRGWTLNRRSPNSERLETNDWPGGHCPHCGAKDALANRGLCQGCLLPAVSRVHDLIYLDSKGSYQKRGHYHLPCARVRQPLMTEIKKTWWKFW